MATSRVLNLTRSLRALPLYHIRIIRFFLRLLFCSSCLSCHPADHLRSDPPLLLLIYFLTSGKQPHRVRRLRGRTESLTSIVAGPQLKQCTTKQGITGVVPVEEIPYDSCRFLGASPSSSMLGHCVCRYSSSVHSGTDFYATKLQVW